VRLDARAVRAHLQGWSSGSGRVSLCVGRNVTSRVVASSSGRESARGTDLRFTPRRAGRQSRGDGGGLLRRRRARAAHPAHPPTRVRESDGSWETTDENTFRSKRPTGSSRFSPSDDLAWYTGTKKVPHWQAV
jgi:hypothetical protein